MDVASLPNQLFSMAPATSGKEPDITIIPYSSAVAIIKGKSRLRQNMISLVTEGEKLIYCEGESIHVQPSHLLLLAAGNYLYTERFPQAGKLTSVLLFFDNEFLDDISKHVVETDKEKTAVQ